MSEEERRELRRSSSFPTFVFLDEDDDDGTGLGQGWEYRDV